jgi:2,3-bisphosphoglycerate-independent phosphoglycerate mutase
MADLDLMRQLHTQNDEKIVLLVLDGVGGLPVEPGGPTELAAASTPNMDRLAGESSLGLINPISPGISPGSGPAHLALFGYDPLVYNVGRGALEAAGIGLVVRKGDVAARGNFCTVDAQGNIIDRRAGRIPSELARPLVELLNQITLPDVETEVRHVKEHRFALVLRGQGLRPELEDTDPQVTGKPPLPARAYTAEAERTAELVNIWLKRAFEVLKDQPQANGVTLRGFSTDPAFPQFGQVFGLRAACIAVYPMYRGVARLVGMEVLSFAGEGIEDQLQVLREQWANFDYFFIHFKKTDSTGEDGDFQAKVGAIERVDRALPQLLELKPDVLAITGDHSTPARMAMHSWHPVPLLLWAPSRGRPDGQAAFSEDTCRQGGLGIFPARELMPLLMAHAGKLEKYGA